MDLCQVFDTSPSVVYYEFIFINGDDRTDIY